MIEASKGPWVKQHQENHAMISQWLLTTFNDKRQGELSQHKENQEKIIQWLLTALNSKGQGE